MICESGRAHLLPLIHRASSAVPRALGLLQSVKWTQGSCLGKHWELHTIPQVFLATDALVNPIWRLLRQLQRVQHIRHDLKQKIHAVGWLQKHKSVSSLLQLGHCCSPSVTATLSIHSLQEPVTCLVTIFRQVLSWHHPTVLCALLHLS